MGKQPGSRCPDGHHLLFSAATPLGYVRLKLSAFLSDDSRLSIRSAVQTFPLQFVFPAPWKLRWRFSAGGASWAGSAPRTLPDTGQVHRASCWCPPPGTVSLLGRPGRSPAEVGHGPAAGASWDPRVIRAVGLRAPVCPRPPASAGKGGGAGLPLAWAGGGPRVLTALAGKGPGSSLTVFSLGHSSAPTSVSVNSGRLATREAPEPNWTSSLCAHPRGPAPVRLLRGNGLKIPLLVSPADALVGSRRGEGAGPAVPGAGWRDRLPEAHGPVPPVRSAVPGGPDTGHLLACPLRTGTRVQTLMGRTVTWHSREERRFTQPRATVRATQTSAVQPGRPGLLREAACAAPRRVGTGQQGQECPSERGPSR